MIWIAVASGGALGSLARYLLSAYVLRVTGALFPVGTVVVNTIGCAVFGAIAGATEQRFALTPELRAFVLVGILGGFTTFSSYIFESAALVRDGQFAAALVNLAGQVLVGLAAFWAGFAAGSLR